MTNGRLFNGDHDLLFQYDDGNYTEGTFDHLAGSGRRPAFLFHAACWEIGTQLFDPLNDTQLAELFCDWQYCTTWLGNGLPIPGHDYGGAAQFRRPGANDVSSVHRMINAGYAYLGQSPMQYTVEVERLINQTLTPDLGFSWPQPGILSRGRYHHLQRGDPFAKLPVEIIYQLLDFLPLTEICSAVQASPRIAHCSVPSFIPQEF